LIESTHFNARVLTYQMIVMETISLAEAAAHVGKSVRFVAAVQQVAKGKRVLVGRQRVQACHVLHVGDATRQFFKVTCWGETPPSLKQSTLAAKSDGDSDPMQLSTADAILRVGDIVLFSFCHIKAYRGNMEAQFVLRNDESATSSTVQLLYRKDRYFSTRDVPLKDLYPMIEWYKQHCRELVEQEASPSTAAQKKNRSTIEDLRENMVASVVCKLRAPKDSASGTGATSELDGVLLCELVMYDTARDAMTVNFWDQHAEKRFVARLLEHQGAIEIDGIVVSLQALSNRLLANTTPHTTFRLLEPDDAESVELDKRLAGPGNLVQSRTLSRKSSGPTAFASLEELEGASFEGNATLENVRVEQMCLGRHFGSESRFIPKFAHRLAERYCSECEQALPELPGQDRSANQPRFGACTNNCKTRRGSSVRAPRAWRYRGFVLVLGDSRNERLQVEVDSQATVGMVGNIEAQELMESTASEAPASSPSSAPFHVTSAVASLLSALVEDATQRFDADLLCTTVNSCNSISQTGDSYQDSSHEDAARRHFRLLSLVPSEPFSV
jgi:hypothetical protein